MAHGPNFMVALVLSIRLGEGKLLLVGFWPLAHPRKVLWTADQRQDRHRGAGAGRRLPATAGPFREQRSTIDDQHSISFFCRLYYKALYRNYRGPASQMVLVAEGRDGVHARAPPGL